MAKEKRSSPSPPGYPCCRVANETLSAIALDYNRSCSNCHSERPEGQYLA